MKIKELMPIIQSELRVGKNNNNEFGKYAYRNIEDIYGALKPLQEKYGFSTKVKSEISEFCEKMLMTSTAYICAEDGEESSVGYAFMDFNHKGMTIEQCTGCAMSYSAKYAFSGLLGLSGEADPDSLPPREEKKGEKQEAKTGITENQLKVINSYSEATINWILTKYDISDIKNLSREQATGIIKRVAEAKKAKEESNE